MAGFSKIIRLRVRRLTSSLVRLLLGERSIAIRGEAGVPFRFRPAEYPTLLRGVKRVDPHIRRAWARLLRPEEVILDIGANIGFTVQRFFSILGPRCSIYAFEPIPRNFELLEINSRALGSDRIVLIAAAVGDRDGQATFCDNVYHGALSRLSTTRPTTNDRWSLYWKEYREIKVEMIALDTFVQRHPEVRPTFVKIDVEGSGAMVVRGAGELLRRHRPAIGCEFHSSNERTEVTNYLDEAGYRGIRFENDGRAFWCDLDQAAYFLHPNDPRAADLFALPAPADRETPEPARHQS